MLIVPKTGIHLIAVFQSVFLSMAIRIKFDSMEQVFILMIVSKYVCSFELGSLLPAGWMEPTGELLANVTNATVILVDYGDISDCNYDRSVREIVPAVGHYLAKVISDLDLDPNNIEIIGHSLGRFKYLKFSYWIYASKRYD